MKAAHLLATLAAGYLAALSTTAPLFSHGAYHDVVHAIEAKLKTRPDDATLHYKLAVAHVGHEEWQACLAELTEVERLAPGVHPTSYLRGLALFIGGKNELAKAALDLFLQANPKHPEALATRGRVWLKLDRPTQAASDLQAALDTSTQPQSELVIELALIYQKLGLIEASIRTLSSALLLAPNDPALLACALNIETAAGFWDSALNRIATLQKLAPSPAPWLARKAQLLAQANRAVETRAAWTALRDYINALPSLERGTPQNTQLLREAQAALGETPPQPVAIPPAS
jgi:tetratricopeptide (TPR) repeat protein